MRQQSGTWESSSERLEEAITRYHTNAITTAEVIQELIKLAKDIPPRTNGARRMGSRKRKSPSMTRWPRTRARSRSWKRPPSRYRP